LDTEKLSVRTFILPGQVSTRPRYDVPLLPPQALLAYICFKVTCLHKGDDV